MIVHFDKDKRNDLVFTISVDENNHIEIIIDQQRPPCGPVPEEPAEIFTLKQQEESK